MGYHIPEDHHGSLPRRDPEPEPRASRSLINPDVFDAMMRSRLNEDMMSAAEPIIEKALKEVEEKMRQSLAANLVGMIKHGVLLYERENRLVIEVRNLNKEDLPMAQKNDIPMRKVESSNVDSVGYDSNTSRMAVAFKNGGLYHYHNVDQKAATAVMDAKSVGSAVRAVLVKGGYKYDRLDQKDERK